MEIMQSNIILCLSGTQYYFDNLAVFRFCYSVEWARFLEWIIIISFYNYRFC